MGTPGLSERRGLTTILRALHERFVAGDVEVSELVATPLRRVVVESWQRSLRQGVDPDSVAYQSPSVDDGVEVMRNAHPLAAALPVIRQLLVEDAASSGVVVAVTAADGTLLWVEGDRNACRRAEAMNFVPGADWSERGAGTNAPGTALALNSAVQIRGPEHFSRVVQPWNCTAVPVHDSGSGALIGALDLTGGSRVAAPAALAVVRATAVAVENHLAVVRLAGPGPAHPPGAARLEVLGAGRPRWLVTDKYGHPRSTTLSGRHAEILVLLARHPEGFTADHLAVLLDEKDIDVVTVRAEMSRLRRAIGAEFIASRPYRLLQPIASDVDDVFTALDGGDVETALSHYRGPLLPHSVSPGIARLRTQLGISVRGAVVLTGNLALLRCWLESPEGRDDREGWRLLRDSAQAGSVTRARAGGHLAGIDFDLGW